MQILQSFILDYVLMCLIFERRSAAQRFEQYLTFSQSLCYFFRQ
ncbi:hypothetical protein PPIS_b0843 [Pseudoalteromonas piscicida]|uniref:Uncharacterized protein n=1 Tax=Pseudoalteromonas piscicida TaxID=43662 RepID=A0ABM6NLM4_PSEO7|nr:hypothetical protein PPIS_b0843 [Pseudoalteromonas piscicida]